MIDSVNILGTTYRINLKKYNEDEYFLKENISGYCNGHIKEIVVCDMHTYKGFEDAIEETVVQCQKEILRHEIVHAFLNESGLTASTFSSGEGWATNEEMVDWFALQGPKIYNAWKETDCL